LGNDVFELKSDETLRNFIKQSSQQMGEKKEKKRENLCPSQKNKTQSQTLRENEPIMFQSHPSHPPSPQEARSISRRERDEKPEKALNLKQLSLRTTTLLKIEATGVLCQKDC